jgi:hypothetical protein
LRTAPLWIGADLIRVYDPAREHEGGELAGIYWVQGLIDPDRTPPIFLVPGLDLAYVQRNHGGLGAHVLEYLLRFEQFGLLKTVGSQNCDLLPRNFSSIDKLCLNIRR